MASAMWQQIQQPPAGSRVLSLGPSVSSRIICLDLELDMQSSSCFDRRTRPIEQMAVSDNCQLLRMIKSLIWLVFF